MKIAVIGSEGFVGRAVVHVFKDKAEVVKIDPLLGNSVSDLKDQDIEVAIICVPTPMGIDGSIDSSIVEQVVCDLRVYTDAIIVLKSTVVPDIVQQLNSANDIVYNPEFLTERNAEYDAEHPFMTVLGGDPDLTAYIESVYREYSICKDAPYYHMTAAEASFVKYGINSFLSTKISFWNQFSQVCENFGARYDVIKTAIGTDIRVGESHMNVPGHDGRRGFGGACFSKDLPAFIRFGGNKLSLLTEAWNINCDIRNSYPEPLEREVAQNIKFNKI